MPVKPEEAEKVYSKEQLEYVQEIIKLIDLYLSLHYSGHPIIIELHKVLPTKTVIEEQQAKDIGCHYLTNKIQSKVIEAYKSVGWDITNNYHSWTFKKYEKPERRWSSSDSWGS